jgi:hypothetical protein
VLGDAIKNRVGLIGVGAVLALTLCPTSSAKNAVAQTGTCSDLAPQVPQQTEHPSQEFQGTIEKAGAKYVLEDKASGATYQLDNQDKAKQYFGEDVKVTGTLDPNTNTIEVSEIQELK